MLPAPLFMLTVLLVSPSFWNVRATEPQGSTYSTGLARPLTGSFFLRVDVGGLGVTYFVNARVPVRFRAMLYNYAQCREGVGEIVEENLVSSQELFSSNNRCNLMTIVIL